MHRGRGNSASEQGAPTDDGHGFSPVFWVEHASAAPVAKVSPLTADHGKIGKHRPHATVDSTHAALCVFSLSDVSRSGLSDFKNAV
jgi:hypothetical protein